MASEIMVMPRYNGSGNNNIIIVSQSRLSFRSGPVMDFDDSGLLFYDMIASWLDEMMPGIVNRNCGVSRSFVTVECDYCSRVGGRNGAKSFCCSDISVPLLKAFLIFLWKTRFSDVTVDFLINL